MAKFNKQVNWQKRHFHFAIIYELHDSKLRNLHTKLAFLFEFPWWHTIPGGRQSRIPSQNKKSHKNFTSPELQLRQPPNAIRKPTWEAGPEEEAITENGRIHGPPLVRGRKLWGQSGLRKWQPRRFDAATIVHSLVTSDGAARVWGHVESGTAIRSAIANCSCNVRETISCVTRRKAKEAQRSW